MSINLTESGTNNDRFECVSKTLLKVYLFVLALFTKSAGKNRFFGLNRFVLARPTGFAKS